MARQPTIYENREVRHELHQYWVAGCRVNASSPSHSLPTKIEDAIIGASWLDSNGSKPLVNPNKLLMILSTLNDISVSAILYKFGEKKDAVILKTTGINERQAQRYAIAARVASNAIMSLIQARRHPTEDDWEV